MPEENELNLTSTDDSKNNDEVSLANGYEGLVEKKHEDNILEQEIQTNTKSSFKPLIFPNEENSEFQSGNSFESKNEKTDTEKISLSEGFKNSEFFYENSLLTNAENFAKSIREGANLYKTQLLSKIEEKVSDTERIHENIINQNNEAKQQREELLSSAKEKVEEIKKIAFQEGFDDGYKVGIQRRYEEAESLTSQANSFLEELNSLRKVVRFRTEKELVELALKIAKNVVAEEIRLNDSVVEKIVKTALQETEMQGKIHLYLNPDDYEFLKNSKCELEKYINEEQSLLIRKRSELKPGSIFVESDGEVISRSLESQFKKIEDTLRDNFDKSEARLNESSTDSENISLIKKTEKGDESRLHSFDDDTAFHGYSQNETGEEVFSENENIQKEMDEHDINKEEDDDLVDSGKEQLGVHSRDYKLNNKQENSAGEQSSQSEKEDIEETIEKESFGEEKKYSQQESINTENIIEENV